MFPLNIFCGITFLILLWVVVGLELYESPNIKTALFTELDILRSCWNHEEINLLRTRMIMQDLIPKKVPRDMPYLVEYIRSTEEAVVRHSSEGKVRRIMMLALSDVLGGYLQAVAIPIAKEAYYAGNIDYATMSRLYELLNEMKSRLRTDGGRWSRPVDMSKFSVKVTALHLPVENSELACKAMFMTPADQCPPGQSKISIPYLDYDKRPGAVALPLKSRNLYSLKTAASSHIIVRFYILARQCLSEMAPKDTDLFNHHFLTWLTVKVIPHLYEEMWYPGFGSVMRIVESVNETQVSYEATPYYIANDTSLEKSLIRGKSCGFFTRLRTLARYNLKWLLLFIALLFLLLLLLFGCCYCLVVYHRRGYKALGQNDSSGILNAVLSIYCGLKEKESSKDESKKPSFDPEFYGQKDSYRRSSDKYPPPKKEETDTSSIPSTSEDEETTSTT